VKIQAFIQGTADAIRPNKEEPKRNVKRRNKAGCARLPLGPRAQASSSRNEGLSFIITRCRLDFGLNLDRAGGWSVLRIWSAGN